jgi:hypothetical protein
MVSLLYHTVYLIRPIILESLYQQYEKNQIKNTYAASAIGSVKGSISQPFQGSYKGLLSFFFIATTDGLEKSIKRFVGICLPFDR